MSDLVPSTSAALMGTGESAVQLPSKMLITRAPGIFELSWRWRDQVPQGAFFAPLAGSLAGMGGMMHAIVQTPWAAIPIVGLYGTMLATMSFAWSRGVMRVRVAQGALTTSGGALSSRSREILAVDIAGIEVVPRSRRAPKPDAAAWAVFVTLTTGKRKLLVGHMLKREQAEAIAAIIRTALAGEDSDVAATVR